MAENKNVENQAKEEQTNKETIDMDVVKDENGQEKAVPKKTFGQKAKEFGLKVWGVAKIAIPAAIAGAGGMYAIGTAIGNKTEKEEELARQREQERIEAQQTQPETKTE